MTHAEQLAALEDQLAETERYITAAIEKRSGSVEQSLINAGMPAIDADALVRSFAGPRGVLRWRAERLAKKIARMKQRKAWPC